MTKVLIIGGGFAGCCAAHLLSGKGMDITLVERAPFLGGGCKTFYHGGHPYTYGPRHFLTQDESIFSYLNNIIPMRRIDDEHCNLTYVEKDGRFYTYPPHADDLDLMPEAAQIREQLQHKQDVSHAENFEDYVIGSLGTLLYDKFFNNYSKKMWDISSASELTGFNWGWRESHPSGIKLREGSKAAWTGWISAFPLAKNGYDDYFPFAARDAKVHLDTTIEAYDVEHYRVKIGGEWHSYDVIISSTYPELLLNSCFGDLRWMGRDFHKIVLPVREIFPAGAYFLYYACQEAFTRIVEYKKFYKHDAPSTLLILEAPSYANKLYAYPVRAEQEKAQKYFDALPQNVYSIGRLGSYRYLDVDNIIIQCRELVEKIAAV